MLASLLIAPPTKANSGGSVFFSTTQGAVIRSRAYPVDPASTAAVYARRSICQPSRRWPSVLTPTQRIDWESYAEATPLPAPHGGTKTISGYAMYLRNQRPRLLFGLGYADGPPTPDGLPTYTPATYALALDGVTLTVTIDPTDDWANQDGGAMFLWAARPMSMARGTPQEVYAPLAIILGGTTPPPPTNVYTLPAAIVDGVNATTVRCSVTESNGRLSI